MSRLEVQAHFPPALLPLMAQGERRRYYVAYGGRGSGKSWAFARALLLQALKEPLRVLCAREVMRTIADSVHRLLADQIGALGLDSLYRIQDSMIYGASGAEFLFTGLRQIDAAKIKSYEGVDIAWVEEAQAMSKKSWDILIPTIRAPESEIWATFNPELDSDDTYQRFVVHPMPDAWVKKVTWRDNPWFPEVLERERLHLLKTDPEAHDHVWEGNCRTVVEGAIYAKEVMQMVEERRIRPVPYDPALKVHTIWDLGWNDQTAIILAQRQQSELRAIGYIEDSQKTLAEYVAQLEKKPYVWGKDWLPHDGGNRDLKTGKSTAELLKKLGRKPVVVPRSPVEEGIRAARMMFPRAYVDESCARLIDCLKRYKRAQPASTGEPGAPVHDEYSHGADAWRTLAMVVDRLDNEDARRVTGPSFRPADPGVGY